MNREAERKRLVELLRAMEDNATITCPRYSDGATLMTCNGCQYDMEDGSCDYAGREADHLLDNGAIVPPVKVGQTVYIVSEVSRKIVEAKAIGVWLYDDICNVITNQGVLHQNAIGETVFLTREDALKALEGKEAVCDGGLSALEEAFYALELCGARVNSNGTINRENLVNYKIENVIKEYLEAKDNV